MIIDSSILKSICFVSDKFNEPIEFVYYEDSYHGDSMIFKIGKLEIYIEVSLHNIPLEHRVIVPYKLAWGGSRIGALCKSYMEFPSTRKIIGFCNKR